MKRLWFLIIVLVPAMVYFYLSATLNHRQFRKPVNPTASPVLIIDDTEYYRDGPDDRYYQAYIEEHYGQSAGADYKYALGFIEFDDQGRFWDEKQLPAITDYIKRDEHGTSMIVYVHGWMNNADPLNQNVACFREMLKAIAVKRALRGKGRRVIGIYIGWTGLLFESEYVSKAFTFWNRLKIAKRIGERSDMFLAFNALKKIYETGEKQKLLVFAHSMGARAVFSSIGNNFRSRLHVVGKEDPRGKGYGDLVVLVNPAIPAMDIKSVFERAERLYDEPSFPDFVIISSEKDGVMKRLFPLALKLTSWLENTGDEGDREALTHSVGTYDPFITHHLESMDESTFENRKPREDLDCLCRYTRAEDLRITRDMVDPSFAEGRLEHWDMPRYAMRITGTGKNIGAVAIIRVRGNIIPSHGRIWTSPFLTFVADATSYKLARD
jgi:hypothetical protein